MQRLRHRSESHPELRATDFYTSHEALLLGYEEALTRVDSTSGDWYATSATCSGSAIAPASSRSRPHRILPRHQEPDRPQVRPVAEADGLLRLIDVLNPDNEPGRLTLINRFGSEKVGDHLPKLVRAVQKEGRKVVWSCDPMHGNTITAAGYKTRPFDRILSRRSKSFFEVHHAEGTHPGGIHSR
jgi:3-deoxy-7-phosphoheptulonate synthase